MDWLLSRGDYLHGDAIPVKTAAGETVTVTTPPGQIKDDPTFGATEIYHDHVAASVAAAGLPATGQVVVIYQRCPALRICYPPLSKSTDLATLPAMHRPARHPSPA